VLRPLLGQRGADSTSMAARVTIAASRSAGLSAPRAATRPTVLERVTEWVIVAYALLASLQPVLPMIGWLHMRVSTALAVALWPLVAVHVLLNPGFYIRRRKLLLLLVLTLIVRIILSPGEDLRERFVMGSIITTFLVITIFCSHPRVRLPNRRLLWAIVLGGCTVGALKLSQFYGQLRWLHPRFARSGMSPLPEFAVRALYDDLGPVLALAAAMALLSYRRPPAVLWLALPLNLAASTCGGSRIFVTASLLVIVGCASMGVLLRVTRLWVACVGLSVIAATTVLGGMGVVQAGRPVLSRIYAPAVEPRVVEMAVEVEIIGQSPLVGGGMYPRYDARIFFGDRIVYGHNTYTGCAAKMGVPWTLGLVGLLVWVTYRLWRLCVRGDPASRPVYLVGAVQFTVLLLAVQWVTNPLLMSPTSPLLGAFAGAALGDTFARLSEGAGLGRRAGTTSAGTAHRSCIAAGFGGIRDAPPAGHAAGRSCT